MHEVSIHHAETVIRRVSYAHKILTVSLMLNVAAQSSAQMRITGQLRAIFKESAVHKQNTAAPTKMFVVA